MATIQKLLIRRPHEWRDLKVPAKFLFDPRISEYLSRELDAEVVTCIVQTTSSVFVFYRYKQGEMLRKIEISDDLFSFEGLEESWEKNLFEGGEEHPSIGGDAVRGLEAGLGLKSIFEVPEINIDYQLPPSLATSGKSARFRILKIIFYLWIASFAAGTLIAIFRR